MTDQKIDIRPLIALIDFNDLKFYNETVARDQKLLRLAEVHERLLVKNLEARNKLLWLTILAVICFGAILVITWGTQILPWLLLSAILVFLLGYHQITKIGPVTKVYGLGELHHGKELLNIDFRIHVNPDVKNLNPPLVRLLSLYNELVGDFTDEVKFKTDPDNTFPNNIIVKVAKLNEYRNTLGKITSWYQRPSLSINLTEPIKKWNQMGFEELLKEFMVLAGIKQEAEAQ